MNTVIARAVCACVVISTYAGLATAQPTTVPDVARGPDGAYAGAGAAYLHIPGIPLPIEASDIERWCWMLNLSDEQAQVFWRMYDQYVLTEKELHVKHVQPLWDRSALLRTQFEQQPPDIATASEYVRLFEDERPVVVRKLVANEDLLFDAVEKVLADEQLSRLDHVRSQRSRQRNRRLVTNYPGSALDPTTLHWSLHEQGIDILPTNTAAFEQAISTYDRSATALFVAACEEEVIRTGRSMLLLSHAKAMYEANPGNMERLKLGAERRNLHERVVNIERQIAQANSTLLGALRGALPVSAISALHARYQEMAYPPIYPDPTDLTSYFTFIRSLDDLSSEQLTALETIKTSSGEARASICNQMMREFESYRLLLGSMKDTYAEYAPAAESLHTMRVNNAQNALQAIHSLLTPSQQLESEPLRLVAIKNLEKPFRPDHNRVR